MFDTIATAVDVDSMVTRFADSAAPMYPPKLLEMKVEGGAYVQFVVDTLGLADTLSFRVISATHPEFAQSVREALAGHAIPPGDSALEEGAAAGGAALHVQDRQPARRRAGKPVSAAKP